MQPDRWEQTKGHILDTFKNVDVSKVELQEPEVGDKEVVFFDGPLGQMKLEYYTRPVVLSKNTHGSRRIGSRTAVEYVYSNTESSHQLKAFKLDEDSDEWVEIEMEKGSFAL